MNERTDYSQASLRKVLAFGAPVSKNIQNVDSFTKTVRGQTTVVKYLGPQTQFRVTRMKTIRLWRLMTAKQYKKPWIKPYERPWIHLPSASVKEGKALCHSCRLPEGEPHGRTQSREMFFPVKIWEVATPILLTIRVLRRACILRCQLSPVLKYSRISETTQTSMNHSFGHAVI